MRNGMRGRNWLWLGGRVRRFRFRLPVGGLVFNVMTFIVLMAALNTGKNLLYLVFSMMTALSAISAVTSALSIRHLAVVRTVPARMFQQQPESFTVQISNQGRLPAYFVRIRDADLGLDTVCPLIRPGADVTLVGRASFPRRGVITLNHLEVSCDFPFGFYEFSQRAARETEVIVYPQYTALAGLPSFVTYNPREGRRQSSRRAGSGYNYLGIREHRPEDGMHRVHWKSSARLGKLVVKEFEREGEYSYVLAMDPAGNGGRRTDGPEACFEQTVTMCAAVADFLIRKRYGFQMLWPAALGAASAQDASLYPVLDALARVQPQPSLGLARLLEDHGPRWEPGNFLIVIVQTAGEGLRRALRQAQYTGARVLVILPSCAPVPAVELRRLRADGMEVHQVAHESEISALQPLTGGPR